MMMMMMGFVKKQVIPSMQLHDVHHFELSEQMETPWISIHKHTQPSGVIHLLSSRQTR